MSDEILGILTKISGDVGQLNGKVDGIKSAIDAHVAQDAIVQTKLFERVNALELAHARQRGAVKVWGLIATGAAGLVTAAFEVVPTLLRKFHGG